MTTLLSTNPADHQPMTTSLEAKEPKTVIVPVQKTTLPSKIGSPEFEKELLEQFAGKHAWRSLTNLAHKLGVDAKELEVFLDKDKRLVRRFGNDADGALLYAMVKRISDAEPDKSAKNSVAKSTIRPEDRYSLATINMLSYMLEKTLDKYGMKIHEQSEESLSHLTKSLKHIQSATVLLAQSTKANPNHLILL